MANSCGQVVVGKPPDSFTRDGFDDASAPGGPLGADGVQDAVAAAAFDGEGPGAEEREPEAQPRCVPS